MPVLPAIALRIAVPAPGAESVVLHVGERRVPAVPDGALWVAETQAHPGEHYWITVDGGPPLLDPSCRDLEWTAEGPRSVVRELWSAYPKAPPLAHDAGGVRAARARLRAHVPAAASSTSTTWPRSAPT